MKKLTKNKKIAIVSILIVVLLGTAFGVYQYNQIKDAKAVFLKQQEAERKLQEELDSQQEAKDGVSTIYQQDRINILLMGFDKNEARDEYYRLFRPDAIVLVSMNLSDDTVDLISFPRDSKVWIAHRPGMDKINASFYYGHDLGGGKTDEEKELMGYKYVVDTVSEFLGNIYINNYIAIDMDGFIKLIDDIGGVEVFVEEDVYYANYENRLIAEAGQQTMMGKQFLAYINDREGDATKDVDRASKMQEAFQMVYDQLKKQNKISIIPKLISNYNENIDTDLSLKEMSALGLYVQKINISTMNKYVVKGEYEYIDNNIYYIPDQNERFELVKNVFGFEFTPER
ncbi:LCP family protein [Alkalibacter mobilis]|uniref:LCP family protein n=1 Tax=Alkalibacter mobilis TaxID=2787712 RepID=UPI00189E36D2|nr:LCP family protein [Alkalibacter mobilis]MBF7096148.1 LCP family protein [Alkalibacter mobilis]